MIDKEELGNILTERYNLIKDVYSRNMANLRFNRHYIGISDIESQHYCERKVHLSYSPDIRLAINEIQNKAMELRTPSENQLVRETIKNTIREDIGTIQHSSIIDIGNGLSELEVVSLFSGIGIIGRLDRIDIDNSNTNRLLVIERKFRDQKSLPKDIYSNNVLVHKASPYPEHKTQARSYCYSIKYMLERTKYANSVIDYSIRYYLKESKDAFDETLDKPLQEYVFNYNADEQKHVLSELSFAIGYWQMKRDSKPCSKNSYRKGLDCIYKLFCNECGWKEQYA